MSDKLPNRKKAVVAMSGGVDSSVAAALLKEAGFDVSGVFMRFWAPQSGVARMCADNNVGLRRYENRCCSSEAENRARSVAGKLKIPFYVFNFEKEFKKKVVDYFLSELKAGRTPNPCVICNKEIKFGLFIEKVLAMGAEYVATGHYARLRREFPISNFQFPIYRLLNGTDKNKDQSYFLWKLNQKQLSRILFPVGGYLKSEVREMARKFNLPSAEAAESQEICFINSTLKEFLERNFKPKPGKIIDTKGNIIGEHQGLWFYTIGQRKGIKIDRDQVFTKLAGKSAGKHVPCSMFHVPSYVLDKDAKKNILIVTQNEKDLFRKEMVVKDVSWISGKEPEFPLEARVKTRYRQDLFSAIIRKGLKRKEIRVIFRNPQRAITVGQSAVFYKGRELLGGGIIAA